MRQKSEFMELPCLAEVFAALRRGRHLAARDGELFQALEQNQEAFTELFARLGFKLIHHARNFYYFQDSSNFTDLSARMAVFIFILVESLSDQGESVEETVMTRYFNLADLPHLQSERYQAYMREAGVVTLEGLVALVRTMERFGFTRRVGSDTFVFAPPIYRFLDLCMDFASQDERKALSELGETEQNDSQ